MNRRSFIGTILTIPIAVCANAYDYSGEINITSHGKKFCPECQKLGLKSSITITSITSTSAWCGDGGWDENGNYVSPPDCNKTTIYYQCSNGHTWCE